MLKERATFIADANGQIFAYRAFWAQWLADLADDIAAAQELLLGKDLANPKLKARCRNGARGDHFPCIIGHYRQSMRVRSVFLILSFSAADIG